jgi:hypothetical protein
MSTDISRMAEHASVTRDRAPEWVDDEGIRHLYRPDNVLHEPLRIRTLVEVRKYWDENDEVARLLQLGLSAPKPYEIVESEGNLLCTAGATAWWTGLSVGTLSPPFNTTNAQLAVGDSSTATSAAHTDLQAAAGTTQNIASSTNATPIQITLSTPLSPVPVAGQVVVITGHTTNTNANGTWEIGTVTSSTVFTLLNSVGNGVGGASGTAAPINKYRQQANGAGSAVITTNSILYVAVVGTANGNFTNGWLEWALTTGAAATNKQATPPPTMFNRAIPNLGVKTSSATWTLSTTLSAS